MRGAHKAAHPDRVQLAYFVLHIRVRFRAEQNVENANVVEAGGEGQGRVALIVLAGERAQQQRVVDRVSSANGGRCVGRSVGEGERDGGGKSELRRRVRAMALTMALRSAPARRRTSATSACPTYAALISAVLPVTLSRTSIVAFASTSREATSMKPWYAAQLSAQLPSQFVALTSACASSSSRVIST